MPLSSDAMNHLIEKRGDLYGRLRHVDDQLAAVQRSPWFGAGAVSAAAIRASVETLEAQIAAIDGRISFLHRRTRRRATRAIDAR